MSDVQHTEPQPIRLDDSEKGTVRLLRKADVLREGRSDLPGSNEFGFMRTTFMGLRASNSYVSFLSLPVGQASPPHSVKAEHIIVGISGELEFTSLGGRFQVGALDQIFFARRGVVQLSEHR